MDDDELSVGLHDEMLFGELMPVARILVTDVYDRPHEVLLLTESAEALRDALSAALGAPAAAL